MKKAVSVQQLSKQFGSTIAVNNVSFDIYEGELFGLLGMNGAGKTTLINMLSCISKPTSGDAIIYGHSIITESEQVKKQLAVSPQETAIAPNLTVKENLMFMAQIYGLSKAEAVVQVDEMIKLFSLQPYSNKKSKVLSGGWKRKLSIAMALISKPKLLFLDEPTLGLDVIARRELWYLIEELKKTTTIILTTHYLEEIEALTDRLLMMKDGVIKGIGTIDELNKLAGKEKFEDTFVEIVTGGFKK